MYSLENGTKRESWRRIEGDTAKLRDPNYLLHGSSSQEPDTEDAAESDDQPLDLTVKKAPSSIGAGHHDDSLVEPTTPSALRDTPVSQTSQSDYVKKMDRTRLEAPEYVALKENGCVHPKKRNWIKMETEDDSFPHEIEEWKKTFASGLCG